MQGDDELGNYDFLLDSKYGWIRHGYASLTGREGVQDSILQLSGDAMVQKLVDSLQDWPGRVIASHKSAGQPFHVLSFLADIGVGLDFPGIEDVINRIKDTMDENGVPTLPVPGEEKSGMRGWALCDAPTILYSLAKIEPGFIEESMKTVEYLRKLSNGHGWPCKVMPESMHFKPPCRKGESCPYATLTMLKLLAVHEDYNSPEAMGGIDFLLDCWDKSEKMHPCMFFSGKDFRRLKAPFVWYDILHAAYVLSSFPYAVEKPGYLEMVDQVAQKADKNGMYAPESIWRAWGNWEFSYKNLPSEWITLKVLEILEKLKKRP